MKTILRVRVLALLLAAAGLVAVVHAGAMPGTTVRAAVQEKHQEFRDAYRKAMELNSTPEMARLIKKYSGEAVAWIMETAEAMSNANNEELEDRMAALRKGWKAAMETGFCDRMYEYFSLLDPVLKRERNRLRKEYDSARAAYIDNLEKKDGPTFELLAGRWEAIADAFEKVGDKYFASESWTFRGACHSEDMRGEKADPYKACAAYKRALDAREAIELEDRRYIEIKQAYNHLAAQGYDKAKESEKAPAVAEAGATLVANLAFEVVDDPDAFERPVYNLDELYPMWTSIYLKAKGSTGVIHGLGEQSPKVLRTGSNDVSIDTDGDGAGDVEIPLKGKLEPVSFQLGSGDETRGYAFLATIGIQQDTYQDIQINLAPDDNQMSIYILPAGSVVGEIAGTPVRVFDDNLSGLYGDPPKEWEHVGISKGNLHPELDSIALDGAKRALPWSEYQRIGDQWYQLEPAKAGTELKATPVEVETGELKLSFKGGKPDWLVVRGVGRFENCYFDLAERKPVEVPAGKYKLFYGELRKGKKKQLLKALILPGAATPTWSVAAGETETIELGAPFGFDFKYSDDEESLTVEGRSVVVTGSAGERYERTWGCVPRPEVSWRKEGSKRGSKGEEMELVLDQDTINEKGYAAAWAPLDLTLEKKGDVEVQLVEKKNKLFGKIESEWK